MKLPESWTTVTLLSKILAIVLFVSLPFIGFYFGYQYHKNLNYSETLLQVTKPTKTQQIDLTNFPTPTTTLDTKTNPTVQPKQNGAELNDIQYSLPQDWNAEIRDGGLFVSPVKDGGYFFIKVYDYSENVGRREYYCQLVGYCIKETYFIETKIGNTFGYIANALGNSGGGPDLFSMKGNKFYIINSYSPPPPNEFVKNSRQFLNSLIF